MSTTYSVREERGEQDKYRWAVIDENTDEPIAYCATEDDAEKVADALNGETA